VIKNIIFDLGNVLVDVNYEGFRNKLCTGISEDVYDNFFLNGNYRLLGYESGMITSDEFVSKCIGELKLEMSRDEFIGSFNNMFTEITPMKELLLKLADERRHNLFLLSNTSPLHFDFVKKEFSYVNRLHKFGLSYELKSLKPEAEIYEKAINHFGVKPEESLFIDDLPENCSGAESFGIRTIVYNKHDHRNFEKEFDKFLRMS